MPARNFIFILIATLVCYVCYNVAVKNRYARLFSEAVSIVENEALQDVPSEKLFQSAMEGMLKDFDQHSAFISGDSFKSLNEDLEGEFGGVGIYFEPVEKQGVLVLAVVPDKPAARAGLVAGDMITAIDGNTAIDLAPGKIRSLMTGLVGVKVDVDYLRDGQPEKTQVERERIAMKSVHGYERNGDGSWDFTLPQQSGLAYIRLTQFDKASAYEMAETLESLPDDTTGVILDVRSNGGGLLTAAERICDMFLKPGLPIVTIKGRKGVQVRQALSENEPLIDPSIRLAILINRHSASASEVVAACLQDHGRAIIIGEQSWGKGTVQNIIPMQLGSSALKLTAFSYWPPSDRPIDRYNKDVIDNKKWGVFPDEGLAVEQEAVDVVCLMKKLHLQEIGGLIPPAKRDEIIDITVNNFLDLVNKEDTLASIIKEEAALGRVAAPVELLEHDAGESKERGGDVDDLGGAGDESEQAISIASDDAKRKISRADIESDPVLEEAIEVLIDLKTPALRKTPADSKTPEPEETPTKQAA